ncbi:hypothetical protein AAZX31_17G198600 [Glycine max]|uniref:SNRNP25 ubiquitin-like domain-containing protein n=1 Tax=Glycine soja TaxID=3848 RepID=A0A445G9M0_GLYSO|nr:U11/U12 small nuclear ribonucleoprotein [Glycine max]RZB57919.1 hypothetical protein D0Y65_046533 [Glycine soja]
MATEHEKQLIVAKPNPNTKSPRRSSTSSSLAIIDGIFARKSFFYDRLPSQPLRLTVLKLDGSCFHIQVSKTATVAELKDAVEAVFSHVPHKGPAKISWAHVWGQFCLCYDGQKLVTEKDNLRNYGIKDGDQLRFIRHVTNNCCVQRKRLKKRVVYLKQHRRSSQVDGYQPKGNCDDDEIGSDDEATDNGKIKHHIEEEEEEEREEECVGKNKLAGFLGELFSYTPLAVVRRTRTKSKIWPTTMPKCLLGSFRKIRSIVCFGRKRHYSRRLPWRPH